MVAHAYLIFIIDRIPVESVFVSLIIEEAVVLVDYLPESLEVAYGCVVVLDFVAVWVDE